jgi:hypothetical protein
MNSLTLTQLKELENLARQAANLHTKRLEAFRAANNSRTQPQVLKQHLNAARYYSNKYTNIEKKILRKFPFTFATTWSRIITNTSNRIRRSRLVKNILSGRTQTQGRFRR